MTQNQKQKQMNCPSSVGDVYQTLKALPIEELERLYRKSNKDIDVLLSKERYKMTQKEFYVLLNFYRCKKSIYRLFIDNKQIESE